MMSGTYMGVRKRLHGKKALVQSLFFINADGEKQMSADYILTQFNDTTQKEGHGWWPLHYDDFIDIADEFGLTPSDYYRHG